MTLLLFATLVVVVAIVVWKRTRKAIPESSSAPPQPASDDEVDDTISRMMRNADRELRTLRGDGDKLEHLIQRIERTKGIGITAMRGRST